MAASIWTGALGSDTASTAALSRLTEAVDGGSYPSAYLRSLYREAAQRYDLSWEILAAINAIETDYGRDLRTSTAGAVGWMQFMPGTWSEYGIHIGERGKADPYNPRDAIFAAARLLAANGGRRHIRQAIFAYNHAQWYVGAVLWPGAGHR